MRLVELTGPGDAEFITTARLVATSIGSQAGMHVDGCDELRLAVAEACGLLVRAGSPTVRISLEIDRMVTVKVCSDEARPLVLDPQSRLALRSLTDELDVDVEAGVICLVKFVDGCSATNN